MKWIVRDLRGDKVYDILMNKFPIKSEIVKAVRNLGLVTIDETLEVSYGHSTIKVYDWTDQTTPLIELERIASGPYESTKPVSRSR